MTILTTGRLTLAETEHRNQTALFMPTDGTQLGVVGGVQSGLALTKTSGLGWSLDIGRAVIVPATAANGPVVATVTVAETGSFAAGDATRDRVDLLTLQIDEAATVANGNPRVKVVIIQGAYPVSGSPVEPVAPAGSVPLWAETIRAGTSAASGWDTTLLKDRRPAFYANAGLAYSAVNTADTNWGYTGGVWREKSASGPDLIKVALRLKRVGAGFAIATGTNYTQAFAGLFPAGFRPVSYSFEAWGPLVDSSDAPVAQVLYKIDANGALFFNAGGASFAQNSQISLSAVFPAA